MAYNKKRSEAIVGLFVLIGLLVIAGLIIQFGRFGDKFGESYTVYVEFKDASGLIKGSEVRLGGARVGKVMKTPALTEDLTVLVELQMDERVKLYEDSVFQITSVSILGDKMIVVVPPEDKQGLIADGSKLMGGGAGGLDELQSNAESVARDARVLMKDARTTLLKVDAAIDDIRAVAGSLAVSLETVNGDVLSEANLSSLKNSLASFEKTSKAFQQSSESIKPTFEEVKEAVAQIKGAAKAAEKTFGTADRQILNIEPALKELPETLKNFSSAAKSANTVMERIDIILAKINKSDGLLGKITNDEEVGNDAKTFVKNLKHYGILRYKDDSNYEEENPKEERFRGKRR